jgi:glyoxylase I family protein
MPALLPITALNHVAVVTRQLDASKKFYCEVLGFREVPRPNFTFAGAWLCNYGLTIHILAKDETGSPPELHSEIHADEIQTRAPHLALHTDDLPMVERLLTEHGIAFRRNMQADTGVKQLFFQDPDGFHIEVGTYPGMRPEES